MAGIAGHYIYDTDGNIVGATGAKLAALNNKNRTEITIDGKLVKIKPGEFYAVAGAVGGKKGTTGGFYANRQLAKEAGAKGGMASRRNWTLEQREKHSKRMKDSWTKRRLD